MNIIVLAGGYSPERDVSLVSGGHVVRALRKKHNILLLDPYLSLESIPGSFLELYTKYTKKDYNFIIDENEPNLKLLSGKSGNGNCFVGRNVLEACKLADVIFIGLHGSIGENGQLQAMFDIFDICYTGSTCVGSLLSMDKSLSVDILQKHGIRVPSSEELEIKNIAADEFESILRSKQFPYVIKPCSGGSSLGVTIVNKIQDIKMGIEYAKQYEDRILIEQYIAGREFTVGILGDEALPVVEICPQQGFFDYKNKYQTGRTDEVCPAQIPGALAKILQDTALKAHGALRLSGYSRTDFIVTDAGEVYTLEVNSLPGLTPASLLPKAALVKGLNYEDLCEKIVELAIDRKLQNPLIK